jgi:transcriptional regulator with XRE-family HTH domain
VTTPGTGGYYKELGQRIRQARLDAGVTQEQVANAASLTRASVANIEAGRQQVLVHTLIALARAVNVTVPELLPGGAWESTPSARVRAELPEDFGAFLDGVLKQADRKAQRGSRG